MLGQYKILYQQEGFEEERFIGFGIAKFYINIKEFDRNPLTQEQITQIKLNHVVENRVFGNDFDPMIHDAYQPSKTRVIGIEIPRGA
jgi:hypothetical protein